VGGGVAELWVVCYLGCCVLKFLGVGGGRGRGGCGCGVWGLLVVVVFGCLVSGGGVPTTLWLGWWVGGCGGGGV